MDGMFNADLNYQSQDIQRLIEKVRRFLKPSQRSTSSKGKKRDSTQQRETQNGRSKKSKQAKLPF
jgi:hypothetical protein